MPRYFLHLRNGTDEILDPDGVELTIDGIVGAALMSARDCIAHDAQHGEIMLGFRIDVHDEGGKVVYSLPFEEAVTITY